MNPKVQQFSTKDALCFYLAMTPQKLKTSDSVTMLRTGGPACLVMPNEEPIGHLVMSRFVAS